MTTGGAWHCPPRRIALGIDFGPASARAAALAGVLAEAFAARVVAIHAEPFAPPPYFTLDQVDRLEEERRLGYVAWTRARRTLTLSYDPYAPSAFLLEAFTPGELGLEGTMAP